MARETATVMVEVEGILEDVLAEVFRKRVCPMLEVSPTLRVRLIVTTQPLRFRGGQDGFDNFYNAGEPGHGPEFTWKTSGAFQDVVHRFRFVFLGNLDARALESYILFGIYRDEEATGLWERSGPGCSTPAFPQQQESYSAVSIVPIEEVQAEPLQVAAGGDSEGIAAVRAGYRPEAEIPPEHLAQVIETVPEVPEMAQATETPEMREVRKAPAGGEEVPEDLYAPLPAAEIAAITAEKAMAADGPAVAERSQEEPAAATPAWIAEKLASALARLASTTARLEAREKEKDDAQAAPMPDREIELPAGSCPLPVARCQLAEETAAEPAPSPEAQAPDDDCPAQAEMPADSASGAESRHEPEPELPSPVSEVAAEEENAWPSIENAVELEAPAAEAEPTWNTGRDLAASEAENTENKEAEIPEAEDMEETEQDQEGEGEGEGEGEEHVEEEEGAAEAAVIPEPLILVEAAKAMQGRNGKAESLSGNLYQGYFGFETMPFNNTPDTHFYFPTERHREALARLLYAISERKGFALITGEIGCGKSTLCRELIGQLPREIKLAVVNHTHLSATQLLRAIAEDLGLQAYGLCRYDILQAINQFLVQQLAAGSTVCIIIDEAQNLDPETLEEVRMISNLETEQDKLVQIIMLAQPEMRKKLALPELKQLRQRIAVQYHLTPLTRAETMQYIRHRLKRAAPSQPLDFQRGAMAEVHRHTGGVPRLINTISDNALLTAFTRGKRKVTRRTVREAARDLGLEPRYGSLARWFQFW